MNKFDYIVFFDADCSIYNFEIKCSFLEYFLIDTLPAESYARRLYKKFIQRNNKNLMLGASESFLNREYFKNFSGMPVKLMREIGYSWYYKSKLELNENFFNQKVMFEIEMHKRNNAQIVLLSKSFLPCLEPLMEEISSNSVICTQLETINGYYTGNIIKDYINVDGKSKAIENFLNNQGTKNFNFENTLNNLEESNMSFCDIAYDYKDDITHCFLSDKFRNLYRN